MSAQEYVEYVYLNYIMSAEFDRKCAGRWLPAQDMADQFKQALNDGLARYGYRTDKPYDELWIGHFDRLSSIGAMQSEGDEFTGRHLKFDYKDKDLYARSILDDSEVARRISRLGEGALATALGAVAEREGWVSASDGSSLDDAADLDRDIPKEDIPASDRVVTIDHNQRDALVSATDEILEKLEKETNSIDGDTNLRARIIGQMKAAKELLLTGIFKLELMRASLMDALQVLALRYENEIIGGLASALIAELVKAIF